MGFFSCRRRFVSLPYLCYDGSHILNFGRCDIRRLRGCGTGSKKGFRDLCGIWERETCTALAKPGPGSWRGGVCGRWGLGHG